MKTLRIYRVYYTGWLDIPVHSWRELRHIVEEYVYGGVKCVMELR